MLWKEMFWTPVSRLICLEGTVPPTVESSAPDSERTSGWGDSLDETRLSQMEGDTLLEEEISETPPVDLHEVDTTEESGGPLDLERATERA
jgi:hypothetical protein